MRQSDRVGLGTIASIRVNQGRKSRLGSRRIRRDLEAGEPTVAREHVCGPGVILTTSVKGAREMHLRRSRQVPRRAQRGALRSKSLERCARVKIMSVGCPQTAGWYPPNEVSREAGAMRGASRSGAGLSIGRRGSAS